MRAIQQRVELEWITQDAVKLIEKAARTCYKSEPTSESADDFVKRIAVNQGHASVVEHAVASFRLITDRGITHEVVRHRLASYSQESTRYVNYTKDKHGGGDIQFIHPVNLTPEKLKFSERAYRISELIYNKAIKIGMTPQEARDYLPNGVKTEIVMTANFREWLHFLKLRTSKAAHPKMRVLATMIGEILAKECPALFGAYTAPQS